MGVVVSDRGDAVEMVVTGPWTSEATTVARAGTVDRLVLNYALGFEEPSLDFLTGLPLRELVILAPQLSDLEPVYSLAPTLRKLHVTTNPTFRIDLNRFPGLQDVAAEWSQVSGSVEGGRELRVAFLRGYQEEDLRPLAPWAGLVELVMKDRPRITSLSGLSVFTGLRVLGIYWANNLADIEDLAGRSTIEDLALERCRKINRLDALAACTGLRSLNLGEVGDLDSLAPLVDLTNLENLEMSGSTKITDADLTPLVALPRLQRLRMRSRSSYRPSVEEVQELLPRV